MKNRKVLIVLLFLFIISLFALYSESLDDQSLQILLLTQELESATPKELEQRLRYLNLPLDSDQSVMRNQLLEYYGLHSSTKRDEHIYEDTFHIESTDRLFVYGDPVQTVVFAGKVQLSFEQEHHILLSANYIALDLQKRVLSALGDVTLIEDEDIIEGELLFFDIANNNILFQQGVLRLERVVGEKKQPIQFITTAERLSTTADPYIMSFHRPFMTTSEDDAYVSINTKDLHLLEGGDIFATNVKISLGRIPLLWLPILYYPGQRFVFNPSFGIDSERGLFFSTTIELYGTYPNIEADETLSFASLLRNEDHEELYADGMVYTKRAQLSPLQTWAQKSESYFALFFDAYERRGVFGGFETHNSLLQNRFVIDAFGGVALSGIDAQNSSYRYQIDPIRFGFKNKSEFNGKHLKLAFSGEMYSDPLFVKEYRNRLTYFSLSALMNDFTMKEDYRSDIPTIRWLLSGRYTIPMGIFSPFIESLNIEQLHASVNWDAKKLSDNSGGGYEIESITFPDLIATAKGKLIRLSHTDTKPSSTERPLDSILSDIAIDPLYRSANTQANKRANQYTYDLSYAIRQSYIGSETLLPITQKEISHYARSSGNITSRGNIGPQFLTFSSKVEPLFIYRNQSQGESTQLTFTQIHDASSSFLGLSYGLTHRFFHQTESYDHISSGGMLAFDDSSVSRHFIQWQYSLGFGEHVIRPSMRIQLPPKELTITPKLTYLFRHLRLSASHALKQEHQGNVIHDDTIITFEYKDDSLIDTKQTLTYRWSMYEPSVSPLDPLNIESQLALSLGHKYAQLSEHVTYDFATKSITQLSLSASVPWASMSVQGSGPIDAFQFDILDSSLYIDTVTYTWWKHRISLSLFFDVNYRHSFWDKGSSLFSFKTHLLFSIAEFIDLDISLSSVNRGFHRYENFSDVFGDLLASFDLFGSGQKESQFTMESIEVDLIHYMRDWDLHCKYQASVVLSDSEWKWSPKFTIFVQWKIIPEMKVDREYDLTL